MDQSYFHHPQFKVSNINSNTVLIDIQDRSYERMINTIIFLNGVLYVGV